MLFLISGLKMHPGDRWVMGIKKGPFCDKHWVLHVSNLQAHHLQATSCSLNICDLVFVSGTGRKQLSDFLVSKSHSHLVSFLSVYSPYCLCACNDADTKAFLKHSTSLSLVICAHLVFLLRTGVGIPGLPLTLLLGHIISLSEPLFSHL